MSVDNQASRANLLQPSASLQKIDENAAQEEIVEESKDQTEDEPV